MSKISWPSWGSAWQSDYEKVPGESGSLLLPQGLFPHLLSHQGPAGFSSNTTVEQVLQQHGAACMGRTVLVIGTGGAGLIHAFECLMHARRSQPGWPGWVYPE